MAKDVMPGLVAHHDQREAQGHADAVQIAAFALGLQAKKVRSALVDQLALEYLHNMQVSGVMDAYIEGE